MLVCADLVEIEAPSTSETISAEETCHVVCETEARIEDYLCNSSLEEDEEPDLKVVETEEARIADVVNSHYVHLQGSHLDESFLTNITITSSAVHGKDSSFLGDSGTSGDSPVNSSRTSSFSNTGVPASSPGGLPSETRKWMKPPRRCVGTIAW